MRMSKDLFNHVLKISTEVDPTGCPGSTSQCLTTPTVKNLPVSNYSFSCYNLWLHYHVSPFLPQPHSKKRILKQETLYFIYLGIQICLGSQHALGMMMMGIHHPQISYASERAKRWRWESTNSPKYFLLTSYCQRPDVELDGSSITTPVIVHFFSSVVETSPV